MRDDAQALEKTRKRREARARASAAKDAVAEMARLHADAIVAIDAEAREKQAKYEEKLLSKAASKAKADAEALEKRAAALDDQAAMRARRRLSWRRRPRRPAARRRRGCSATLGSASFGRRRRSAVCSKALR